MIQIIQLFYTAPMPPEISDFLNNFCAVCIVWAILLPFFYINPERK